MRDCTIKIVDTILFMELQVNKNTKNTKNIFWDSASFRPDFSGISARRKYNAQMTFMTQNLPDGTIIRIPYMIKLNGIKHINVR